MTDPTTLEQALDESLRIAPRPDSDLAAVELARRYCQLLDDPDATAEVYDRLGPKLLGALTALGLTAAGRGSKGGAPDAPVVSGTLDELRRRREQRAG